MFDLRWGGCYDPGGHDLYIWSCVSLSVFSPSLSKGGAVLLCVSQKGTSAGEGR